MASLTISTNPNAFSPGTGAQPKPPLHPLPAADRSTLGAPRSASRPHPEATLCLLLVAPEPGAGTLAQRLRRDLKAHVTLAGESRLAMEALHHDDFDLILLEENLAAAEPQASSTFLAASGTTPVLDLNFGISGTDRLIEQVRSAWNRRLADEAKAHHAVQGSLQNQLNASLAGLLLESQLALRNAGPEVLPALQNLIQLASDLRLQLRQA